MGDQRIGTRVVPLEVIKLDRSALSSRGTIATDPGNVAAGNLRLARLGPPISHVDAIFNGDFGCFAVDVIRTNRVLKQLRTIMTNLGTP